MSIVYNKVARTSQIGDERKTLYYPNVRRIKRVDEKEIARRLARNTTLSYHEAIMAINQFRDELLYTLLQGYTVSLGDWASFFLTVQGNGAATREECTANQIRNVRAHCRFTPAFRQELNRKADFIYSGDLLTTQEENAAGGEEEP